MQEIVGKIALSRMLAAFRRTPRNAVIADRLSAIVAKRAGCIAGSWLYIPLTLGTQLLLIPFTDFSQVAGVLKFNVISLIPSLVLNVILSLRGFHRYAVAAR